MNEDNQVLLAGIPIRSAYALAGPPSRENVRAMFDFAGFVLPADYTLVIEQHDGLEGWFGNEEDEAYIVLYPCAEAIDVNGDNRREYPNSPLFAVGGNGGGEVFAIDRNTGEWVMVNQVDLGTGTEEIRFPNLRAMLEAFIDGTAFD
jgi:hypothetical protein